MTWRCGMYSTPWCSLGLAISGHFRYGGRSSGIYLRILWWTVYVQVDEGKR